MGGSVAAIRRVLVAVVVLSLVAVACSAEVPLDSAAGDDVQDSIEPADTPRATDPLADAAEPTVESTTAPGTETTASPEATAEPPGPASISVTVAEGRGLSETIGIDGGTISATSDDGTVFTLTVPAKALFDDVDITMTPLADASGEALGDSPVAGVLLEPSGLQFLGAATLEISGAGVPADAVGFTADSSGDGFYLVPSATEDGTTVTVPVSHFSLFGIGEAQLRELAGEHRPNGPAPVASQLLAVAGSGIVPEERQLQTATNVLLGWISTLETQLGPNIGIDQLELRTVDLRDLGQIGDLLAQHLSQFNAASQIEGIAELSRLGDELIEGLRRVYRLWGQRVSAFVDGLSDFCRTGQIAAGFDIARWWTIGGYLQAARTDFLAVDIPVDDWLGKAADCFTFDARWNVDVVNKGDGVTTPFKAQVEATLPDESTVDDARWVEQLITRGRSATASAPSSISVTDGPFGACDGVTGGAGIELSIETEIPNLGDVGGTLITGMTGVVGLIEPVDVNCPQLLGVSAPVVDVFFKEPIAIANAPWVSQLEGYSTAYSFPLEVGPHPDSSIARFDHQVDLGGNPSVFEVLEEFTIRRAV